MRIYFFEWNKTNLMNTRRILMRPTPKTRRAKCIGQASNSGKCIDMPHFPIKTKVNANLLTLFIHDRKTKSFAHVREKL